MRKKLVLLLCACTMIMNGCGKGSAMNPSPADVPAVQTESEVPGTPAQDDGVVSDAVAEKEDVQAVQTDDFGKAEFFVDRVYEEVQGNVLVSPISLNIALGLATEGASGETAQELYRYLGREDYADWVAEYMEYVQNLKDEDGDKNGYRFHYMPSNSIWVKNELNLQADYQKMATEKFHAIAQNVDFMGDPDGTEKKINSWCEEKTKGLIREMISKDDFDPNLMVILLNSVYFESPWINKWRLTQHSFTDLSGNTAEKEMLEDDLDTYYENEYATAFSKNYYNGFQFIGILPKTEGDFQLGDLDLGSLLESETQDYKVKAIAPKMNYETETKNVIEILEAQGVHRAFHENDAEFSNMIDDENCYINKIIQKCKIELDEKGTRAAASTAITMKKGLVISSEPAKEIKEVYLDRPFAFLIYDSENDQIVFAGKVVE